MSLSPGFTEQEIIDAVEQYIALPWGTKTEWLSKQRFSRDQLQRWRAAYAGGDIGRSLVPRQTTSMDRVAVGRVRDLQQELAAVRAEADKLRAEVEALRDGNVALGKAIGFLHETFVHEPEASSPTTPASPPS